eukprot:scaffold91848_cov27-Tisochrysis_lutea.AAC.1
MHGYLNSFTFPKSSAVASKPSWLVAPCERAIALMSVPSDSCGHIPRTDQPKSVVCVAHWTSRILDDDFSCRGRQAPSALWSFQYRSS